MPLTIKPVPGIDVPTPTMTPLRANLRNLSVLGYAIGYTLWVYRAENLAQALEPGFFSGTERVFSSGDTLIISAPDGQTMRWLNSNMELCSLT